MTHLPYQPFSKNFLERVARDLRATPGCLDGKILRVESLVEKHGFKIFPILGLREEFGVEAYLPKKEGVIFVDEALMNASSPRYFFTLLEELSHSLIHVRGKYVRHGASVDEIHEAVMNMHDSTYNLMERDAKYFAGALLMPRDEFIALFKEHYETQKAGLGQAGDRQTLVRSTLRRLYQTYFVSFEAASFRAFDLKLIKKHDLHLLARYRPEAFSRPI